MEDKKLIDDKEADRGFNDQELADIMSEIENLEEDYQKEAKTKSVDEELAEGLGITKNEAVDNDPIVEVEQDNDLQKTIDDEVEDLLKSEDVAEVIEMKSSKETPKKVQDNSHCPTSMEFSVAGNMQMQMRFDVSGQVFNLHIDGEEGLCLYLDGGMKFTLPIKKAA